MRGSVISRKRPDVKDGLRYSAADRMGRFLPQGSTVLVSASNEGLRPLGRQSRGTNESRLVHAARRGPAHAGKNKTNKKTNQQIPVAAGICEKREAILLKWPQN